MRLSFTDLSSLLDPQIRMSYQQRPLIPAVISGPPPPKHTAGTLLGGFFFFLAGKHTAPANHQRETHNGSSPKMWMLRSLSLSPSRCLAAAHRHAYPLSPWSPLPVPPRSHARRCSLYVMAHINRNQLPAKVVLQMYGA